MTWSVRQLLEFSYVPGINAAYEGSWAGEDQVEEAMLGCTLDLDWFDDGGTDANNSDDRLNDSSQADNAHTDCGLATCDPG